MLPIYNQFAKKQTVRRAMYLLNPTIVKEDELALPKFTTVHYLDTTSDVKFPTRGLYYYNSSSRNKRGLVQNIHQLNHTEGTAALKNKHVMRDVQQWKRDNIDVFLTTDLIDKSNNSTQSIELVNYNLLKDLYNYKGSLTAIYQSYYNLRKTYWENVITAVENSSEEGHHLVTFNIPDMIPSYITMDRLSSFELKKLTRIIPNDDFRYFLDLYRWVNGGEDRDKSILKDLTDKNSEKILLELRYKGCVVIVPLSILRGLHEDSELESQVKYKGDKVRKVFMKFFHVTQGIIEGYVSEENVAEDNSIEVNTDDEDDDSDNSISALRLNQVTEDDTNKDLILPNDKKPKREVVERERLARKPKKEDIDVLDDELYNISGVDGLITNSLSDTEEEESISDIDKAFLKSILEEEKKEEKAVISSLTDQGDVKEEETILSVDYSEDAVKELLKTSTLEMKMDDHIEQARELRVLSSAQVRSLRAAKEKRDKLTSPYDNKVTLDEFSVIEADYKEIESQDSRIPDSVPVVDDAYKRDILKGFDDSYLRKLMKKDIVACVKSLENSGIMITDYAIESVNTSTDNYDVHRVKVKPIKGKESTITFRLPRIDKEGIMRTGNIKVKLRKVRTDLPIRKISPYQVALNSNYSKLFVNRTERSAYDTYSYYVNYIQNSYLSDGAVSKLVPEIKKLTSYELPKLYQTLASNFNEIKLPEITFITNYYNQNKYIKEEDLRDIVKRKLYFVGHLNDGSIVVSDIEDNLFNYTRGMVALKTYDEYLQIDSKKVPKSFSTLKVLGKDIPLGVCLSYLLGFSGLLSVTGVQYQVLDKGKRYSPEANETVLTFADKKIVLTLDTEEKRLVMNGFLFYADTLKTIPIESMDNQNVYLNIVEQRKQGVIHLKELEILRDLFLDPITVDVLKEMGEPHEFYPLILRANELLATLDSPDINDPAYSRVRGYDRVPGLMYRALSEAIRAQRIKGRANSKVELDPYQVWNYIMKDNTAIIVEETNPIVDLKEREVVTFTGRDGLQSRSTPMQMRSFHKNDTGLVSEATVDSADVALNTYLTPYAKLKNARGMIDVEDEKHVKNQSMVFSTSAGLAPFSDIDDPKRINFVSIQNGHTILAAGYTQPTVRSGHEYIMPYRVGSLYANMAAEDGTVTHIGPKTITVTYKSGEIFAYPLGEHMGRMEGTVYPHSLVTRLKVGDKFKRDDYISYNKGFFEPAWENPDKLVMKLSGNITTAITLNDEVFEDSSAMHASIGKKMATEVIMEKIFRLETSKHIVNLPKVGDSVTPADVLFTILDEHTDYTNLSESSVQLLSSIGSFSPKSGYNGTIDAIEVKYNGEKSDMSPSFRKICNQLDKELDMNTKNTEYHAKDNRVSHEYRSEGKNINVGMVELKIFIRVTLEQSVGDKGVFGHQMKSVISEIYTKNIVTDSGEVVEGMTGYIGVLNRMVNSILVQGATQRLIKKVSPKVADIYFGN